MKDYFNRPSKIGDNILFINDNDFTEGVILSIPEESYVKRVLVKIENGREVWVRELNFIIINDIIYNNPQYFI